MSREEICDNIVNCLHSMDDEISCDNCPVNCEFGGYTMTCHLDNSIEQIILNGTNYIKGLILKLHNCFVYFNQKINPRRMVFYFFILLLRLLSY